MLSATYIKFHSFKLGNLTTKKRLDLVNWTVYESLRDKKINLGVDLLLYRNAPLQIICRATVSMEMFSEKPQKHLI